VSVWDPGEKDHLSMEGGGGGRGEGDGGDIMGLTGHGKGGEKKKRKCNSLYGSDDAGGGWVASNPGTKAVGGRKGENLFSISKSEKGGELRPPQGPRQPRRRERERKKKKETAQTHPAGDREEGKE